MSGLNITLDGRPLADMSQAELIEIIHQLDSFIWLMSTEDELPMVAMLPIVAERRRQVEVEGWSAEHDDQHQSGEIAKAAACYAWAAGTTTTFREIGEWWDGIVLQRLWPWHRDWWKPKDRRADLVRAGALILAEIERLDRLARKP